MKSLPPALPATIRNLQTVCSLPVKLPVRVLLVVTTTFAIFTLLTLTTIVTVHAGGQTSAALPAAKDPGVRTDAIDAGQPLGSVAQTPGVSAFFANGQARFEAIEVVRGGANNGLGPRFNSNQCSSCHAQPAVGGSSPSNSAYPAVGPNPETQVYNLDGAANTLPSFITADGPVREARFVHFLNSNGSVGSALDGGVHDLFTIQGDPTPPAAHSRSRISIRTLP
jgi:hypothetical protein